MLAGNRKSRRWNKQRQLARAEGGYEDGGEGQQCNRGKYVQFQPPSVENGDISSKCHKGVGVAACMENMMYKLEKTNNHF